MADDLPPSADATPATVHQLSVSTSTIAQPSFDSYTLDRRITKALQRLHYTTPTQVQHKSIPLALTGRDVLIKSRTGTGKTMSYIIPIIQRVLHAHTTLHTSTIQSHTHAIILVPTRELIDQVVHQIRQVTHYCDDLITVYALHAYDSNSMTMSHTQHTKQQTTQLSAQPHIIVCTPSTLLTHYRAGSMHKSLNDTLGMLVIDEADLILSYGYIDDVRALQTFLPKLLQTILCSATLTTEVTELRKLILHSPATVNISDNPHNLLNTQLAQLYIECNKANDKFLCVYAMLKLGLLKGKILFYVNSVDTSYKLKLLLEQFSITSAVLNAELPYNSRQRTLQQFNRGMFDYLICTDEAIECDVVKKEEPTSNGTVTNAPADKADAVDVEQVAADADADTADADSNTAGVTVKHEDDMNDADTTATTGKPTRVNIKRQRGEFGVTRGIDFQHVNVVINYDFPLTVNAYTHRIGRTGRAGNTGLALSIIDVNTEQSLVDQVIKHQKDQVKKYVVNGEAELKPLALNGVDLDGFRYRVEDISRAVTRHSVREARINEIKNELLNSTKLAAHFEDNPHEMSLLQYQAVHTKKAKPYLTHVPQYLIPANMKPQSVTGKSTRHVTLHGKKGKDKKHQKKAKSVHRAEQKRSKQAADPLQSFKTK